MQERSKKYKTNRFTEDVDRSTEPMAAGPSPSARCREAGGSMTSDGRWGMGGTDDV